MNDLDLQYRRLPQNVFGYTLIAGTTSKRVEKHAEVFATNFGCTCVFTMKNKSEAHEYLSLLFIGMMYHLG